MDLNDNENLETRWANFRTTAEGWGLRHFSPEELIAINRSKLPGPDEEWPTHVPPHPEHFDECRPTAHLADEIRHRWGGPVQVLSGFRPILYNDIAIGEGASEKSQHLTFRALDLQPTGAFEWSMWRNLAREVVEEKRNKDGMTIGFGRYHDDEFVHVDVGGYEYNRNWHIGND